MNHRSALVAASLVACARLGAQSPADTLKQAELAEHHVAFTYGVSTGALHFGDGGHERALSGAVGVQLPHGFSLSVNPTYAWAQAAPSINATTGQSVRPAPVQGMADLPVGVGYWHSFNKLGLWAGLGATFPTGDTLTVGSGEASYGANVSVSVDPTENWSVSMGAGHSLSNDYAAGLGTIAPTSVSLGASHKFGAVTANAGYSTEMGAMPVGTTHSQTISGGASVPLGGDVALTLDGSTGRADGANSWAMALGIGTTFAGVAQVNPFAAASRLAAAFGTGRSMSKSRSTAAKAAAAAKKLAHGRKLA